MKRNCNAKYFFSALIVTLIVLFPFTADAKVIALITQENGGNNYEYDYDMLLDSYVESLFGEASVLFDDYLQRGVTMMLDDKNGYVDYAATLDVYADAILSGKQFDLNAYTSGSEAKVVDLDMVYVVTEEKGKLKFTEKIIGDPVEVALREVNSADDASSLRSVLEKRADVLELDLGDYNQLSDYGKTLVAQRILENSKDDFTDIKKVKEAFNQQVQDILDNPVEVVLDELNSVDNISLMRQILENEAETLGLDLSNYSNFNENSKNAVAAGVLESRGDGYSDVESLASVFIEKVQAVTEAFEVINSADGVDKFEEALLDYGKDLGLEMDVYELIISTRRQQVLNQIYDSVPFANIDALCGSFNQAVGSMLRSYVVVSYSDYARTVEKMVDIQMTKSPQWWNSGWKNAPRSEVRKFVDPDNFVLADLADHVSEVIIAEGPLRVRAEPTTESDYLGTQVHEGEVYPVVGEPVEVLEGTSSASIGYWFKIDTGTITGWVSGNYTDWVAEEYGSKMLQFLSLSGPSGVTVTDLGVILDGKGILSGTETAFYQASRENNINEIFLTSLALHESGHGTSTLATGITYNGKTVYNMFGIGAVDKNPNYYGAQYAYEHGWFSPEEAIIGGAHFASQYYVNNSKYYQDTLYKMRWNPGSPGNHQYATDVAWASSQTSYIWQLYGQVDIYNLRFDIPRYERD